MHDVTRSSLLVYTAVADIIAATPASCSVKSKTRRSRHRSATAVAASALILSGCVNTVRDLRVSSVAFTNGSQWGLSSAEDRQMLRIDITSQADLPHLAAGTGMILSAHAFFCDHSLDSALLGGFLFATAPGNGHPPARVYQLEEMPVELRNSASLYTYHLILNVALPASPLSRPPEIGFDLVSSPEDVCIQVRGGYIGFTMRSNVLRIPSQAIGDAVSRRNYSEER